MATLKDIKTRIVSITNTQQVTKAMKMVSAAKLRRAQQNIESARNYSDILNTIFKRVFDLNLLNELSKNSQNNARVVLFTSDKGLCGGLNINLCKKVLNFYEEEKHNYDAIEFLVFGKKGEEYLKRRSLPVNQVVKNLNEKRQKNECTLLSKNLIDDLFKGGYSNLFVAYNRFQSALTQIPTVDQILPVKTESDQVVDSYSIYEPDKKQIFIEILKKTIENTLFTALLDNLASEHGSRMTAMESASNNAKDVISRLQLQYNRARQATITKELIEIISGAEAIN